MGWLKRLSDYLDRNSAALNDPPFETPRAIQVADFLNPQEREDLMRVLARGLNTWQFPPVWLVDLQQELMRRSNYRDFASRGYPHLPS